MPKKITFFLFFPKVCTTTLWVGHLSKLVQQEELSDTFGKYGDIVSIDMIIPRGCAFIVMHRRQDAFKAMNGLKNVKMQGRVITISWAAGKGVKSKEWKDYWDLDLGVSYIPWEKIARDVDLEALEEGGMFDEDSMPLWIKEKQAKTALLRSETNNIAQFAAGIAGLPDVSQPPPSGPQTILSGVTIVPQFSIGQVPRFLPPPMMGIVPGMPLGVPPPQVMLGMPPDVTGPPPPIEKKIPPLNVSSMANAQNTNFIGGSMQPPQFPPIPLSMPPPVPPPSTGSSSIQTENDDHMDIELDDEDKPDTSLIIFNKPPPISSSICNATMGSLPNNQGGRNIAPYHDMEHDLHFDHRKENDDFRNNQNNSSEKNDRFKRLGRRWNEEDRPNDIIKNDGFGSGIQNRLRELADGPDTKRDKKPPSLLDMAPIQSDSSNLPKNIWNVNSMSVNQIGQRNFLDNRRNIEETRNPSIGHGSQRQRMRNDDRDMFNSMRRDGMLNFKLVQFVSFFRILKSNQLIIKFVLKVILQTFCY